MQSSQIFACILHLALQLRFWWIAPVGPAATRGTSLLDETDDQRGSRGLVWFDFWPVRAVQTKPVSAPDPPRAR